MGSFRNTAIAKSRLLAYNNECLTVSMPTDSTTLLDGQLVKYSSSKLVACGATDKPVGVVVTPLSADTNHNVKDGHAVVIPFGTSVRVQGAATAAIVAGDELAVQAASNGVLMFKKAATNDIVTAIAFKAASANEETDGILYLTQYYVK